jgi:phage-related protein
MKKGMKAKKLAADRSINSKLVTQNSKLSFLLSPDEFYPVWRTALALSKRQSFYGICDFRLQCKRFSRF